MRRAQAHALSASACNAARSSAFGMAFVTFGGGRNSQALLAIVSTASATRMIAVRFRIPLSRHGDQGLWL
jgi:hypothetical protein